LEEQLDTIAILRPQGSAFRERSSVGAQVYSRFAA
jgi:hypothetical protein